MHYSLCATPSKSCSGLETRSNYITSMGDTLIPDSSGLEPLVTPDVVPMNTANVEEELDEREKRRRSFERSLAGPSVGKAGLVKDQAEINRIIAEASKVCGSTP